MRLLVCGGREYTDEATLTRVLDAVARKHNIECVIHGDARGADRMAGAWAEKRGILVVKFPANWKKYGDGAGPIRNQQMIDTGKPTAVIAFPGKIGTPNMITKAKAAGIKVWEP